MGLWVTGMTSVLLLVSAWGRTARPNQNREHKVTKRTNNQSKVINHMTLSSKGFFIFCIRLKYTQTGGTVFFLFKRCSLRMKLNLLLYIHSNRRNTGHPNHCDFSQSPRSCPSIRQWLFCVPTRSSPMRRDMISWHARRVRGKHQSKVLSILPDIERWKE